LSNGKNRERALFQYSKPMNAEVQERVKSPEEVKEENLPKMVRRNGPGDIRNGIEG